MPDALKLKCCKSVPQRYVMCFLSFGAVLSTFMGRVVYLKSLDTCCSIEKFYHHQDPFALSDCPPMLEEERNDMMKELHVDVAQRQIATRSFFIGYMVFIIPGGMVADFYGLKVTMVAGLFISAVGTLLTPTFVSQPGSFLAAARFVQGIAQALVMPSVAVVISRWAPAGNRVFFTGLINSGIVMGWWCSYQLSELTLYGLSPSVPFYITGSIGIFWVFLWLLFSSSSPNENPNISEKELKLLDNSSHSFSLENRPLYPVVPWKSIFMSGPVWSLIALHWASTWLHHIIWKHFVNYLIYVIRITDKLANDTVAYAQLLSILPAVLISGFVSDYLVKHEYMTRTSNRKLFGSVSNLLAVPFLLAVPLVKCDGVVVVSLFVAFSYFHGPYYSVMRCNIVDLSPRFAGLLQGLVSCASITTGLFISELYKLFCSCEKTANCPSGMPCWWIMFGTTSVLAVVLTLPYLKYGSAEEQSWNYFRPPLWLTRESTVSLSSQ